MAEAGLSAGWQHRNSSSRVLSACSVGPGSRSYVAASSRRRRAKSERCASMAFRAATVTGQAFGSAGTCRGPPTRRR
ncbi:MAG: hypothetical protein JWR58_1395 [Pseudonocardia sp.]|jgi:hypothetical protein|nr:hypothetical protein [Pseudonocardia sp.]